MHLEGPKPQDEANITEGEMLESSESKARPNTRRHYCKLLQISRGAESEEVESPLNYPTLESLFAQYSQIKNPEPIGDILPISSKCMSSLSSGEIPLPIIILANPKLAFQLLIPHLSQLAAIMNYLQRRKFFKKSFEEGLSEGLTQGYEESAKAREALKVLGTALTGSGVLYILTHYLEQAKLDQIITRVELRDIIFLGFVTVSSFILLGGHFIADDARNSGRLIGERLRGLKFLRLDTSRNRVSLAEVLTSRDTWCEFLREVFLEYDVSFNPNHPSVVSFCQQCSEFFSSQSASPKKLSLKRIIANEVKIPKAITLLREILNESEIDLIEDPKISLFVVLCEIQYVRQQIKGAYKNHETENIGEILGTRDIAQTIKLSQDYGLTPDFNKYGYLGQGAMDFYNWITDRLLNTQPC